MSSVESILEQYSLNELVIEHRVQSQELIKLKEENVNFGDIIKENIAKNVSRELLKKVSFTKKYNENMDDHSFRGRLWVFNKEELIELIKEVKNA